MLPDRVSNPGPLTYESGALPIALRGPALHYCKKCFIYKVKSVDMQIKRTASPAMLHDGIMLLCNKHMVNCSTKLHEIPLTV